MIEYEVFNGEYGIWA